MATDLEPAKKQNMISGMESLLSLKGDELVEVVRIMPDGSYKNYRTLASKLRVGQSAYDMAVLQGFVGTEEEWIVSLQGESAYDLAVRVGGFVGTEVEWVESIKAFYEHDPANAGKILVADNKGMLVFEQLAPKHVGLDQVDNTSDLKKPVSELQKQEMGRYVLRTRLGQENDKWFANTRLTDAQVEQVATALGYVKQPDGLYKPK